jgi:microcystin-dependent protein
MSDEEAREVGDATSDGYIGEIRAFPYHGFVPSGWAPCDGQLLEIVPNTALFSVIGTVYGGDGRTNFGLPDLRGRLPVCWGSGGGLTPRQLGDFGGTDAVKLSISDMPSHNHALNVSTHKADERQPVDQYFASGDGIGMYAPAKSDVFFYPGMMTYAGGGAAHDNQMPYLNVRYAICIQGVFPH